MTTATWIPPYTIGRSFKVYGQQTAFVRTQLPPNIAPSAPITGEYSVIFFTDQYLNESPGFGYQASAIPVSPIRNPLSVTLSQELTNVPGGTALTVGPLYIPSAGRAASIDHCSIQLNRVQPATALGYGDKAAIYIYHNASLYDYILLAALRTNLRGHDRFEHAESAGTILNSAVNTDAIAGNYSNNDTGGQVDIIFSIHLTEYDVA
jgi:hypothetical protein